MNAELIKGGVLGEAWGKMGTTEKIEDVPGSSFSGECWFTCM